MIVPMTDGWFRVRVLVAVSPQIFGWVTGSGGRLRIAGPAGGHKESLGYLKGIMAGY